MKKFILVFLFVLSLFSLSGKTPSPRYIILFIGDGMALPQRLLAEEFSRKTEKKPLLMNSFPYHATTHTVSANSLTTDSAASATAIACGVKTNNGRIGTDPKNNKLVSAAEMARDKGKKVGIITTVTLNHATPSGFYGHRKSRTEYYELGLDLVSSRFDFFGGGGLHSFNKLSPDLFTLAKQNNYVISRGRNALDSMKKENKNIFLASSEKSNMPYAIDLSGNIPTLAEITEKAIQLLDNPKGFFLMVEGGLIDYAGHSNEAATNMREVLALDAAVKKAYEFYQKHPEETLILVTGDHETGGLTLGVKGKKFDPLVLAQQKSSSGVFKSRFTALKKEGKIKSFEDAKAIVTEYFGLLFQSKNPKEILLVTPAEQKAMEQAFHQGKLPSFLHNLMNQKAGLGWSTTSHTAIPVLTTATGKGAENFTGFIENTFIAEKIKELL